MRIFNTICLVRLEQHYCVPPLERFELADVFFLIDQDKSFVLHTLFQISKASYLLALMGYLNQQGKYLMIYFYMEAVLFVWGSLWSPPGRYEPALYRSGFAIDSATIGDNLDLVVTT